jgi:hypothetical protein
VENYKSVLDKQATYDDVLVDQLAQHSNNALSYMELVGRELEPYVPKD